MPIVAKSGNKLVHLAPTGTIQAVCFDVWDLGFQKAEWKGQSKVLPKIYIAFELGERIDSQDEMKGQRYRLFKKYTLSLGDKATLYKDLTSWRGKGFSDEEKKGFDVENLVGANCLLTIVHAESNGRIYANINAVTALPKGMPLIQPENKRSHPEWIKKIQSEAVSGDLPVENPGHDEEEDIPF